ncbi:hypothetical protein PsYK624_172000 [Phanerochaete sordida]|uniref:Tyr recombinase domain-containing protein n=1 Tax=Phanerochaete sordida TaxID=48140 RepID=A0A9P3GS62_9APHY|nr:hypothetical protein PsYK624_172000 [Phanerochaete sordida]
MMHGWAASTLATYGTALALYHRACDELGLSEVDRAPVAPEVFAHVLAHLAGTASQSTLINLQAAVRAWHLLNQLPWTVDRVLCSKVLDAARAMAPAPRAPRQPYTLEKLERALATLSSSDPLDVAVYACACVLFWAVARAGELTVPALTRVDFTRLVRPGHVRPDVDRTGNAVTVVHLPYTKSSRERGEDVSFSAQHGPSDPVAALERQRRLNAPDESEHLFAYSDAAGRRRPLTRGAFLARMRRACQAAGFDALAGHAFRIGGTLEYLLRGLSLEAVRTLGRWSSDRAFALYLRNHSQIMAPYLQAVPQLRGFLSHALPPVR